MNYGETNNLKDIRRSSIRDTKANKGMPGQEKMVLNIIKKIQALSKFKRFFIRRKNY